MCSSNALDRNLKPQNEMPVFLQKINFKYNFEIGSSDSLDFHIALSNVKEANVFTSETILLLIEYKWRKIGWIVKA